MMLNFEELPASSRQVECPKMDRELNHGSISPGDERGWTIGEGENPRHSRNQEIKSPPPPPAASCCQSVVAVVAASLHHFAPAM